MNIFQNKALNHAKHKTYGNNSINNSSIGYKILDPNIHNFLTQLNTKLHEYVTNKKMNSKFKKKLNYNWNNIKQKKKKNLTLNKEGNSNSLINKINLKLKKNIHEIIKQNTLVSFAKPKINENSLDSMQSIIPKESKEFPSTIHFGNNIIQKSVTNEFVNSYIKKGMNEKNNDNIYQISNEVNNNKISLINQNATKKVNLSNYETFPNSKEFYTTFNFNENNNMKNKNTLSNFTKLRTKINFCKIKKGSHLIFNSKERRDFHRDYLSSFQNQKGGSFQIKEDPILIHNFNYQNMHPSSEYNIIHKETIPSRLIDDSRFELLLKLKKYK